MRAFASVAIGLVGALAMQCALERRGEA